MNEWLRGLSKSTLVILVLGAGILLIVLFNPPRTLCDGQIDVYKTATNDFWGTDSKKVTRRVSRFAKLMAACKQTGSAGGCYELFLGIRSSLRHIDSISPECYAKLGQQSEFKIMVWDSLDQIARLAWGAQPPETPTLKTGWLDAADLNVYCQLKAQAIAVYGETRWSQFVEGYFKDLPGAKALPRADAWQKMIFSLNCTPYL